MGHVIHAVCVRFDSGHAYYFPFYSIRVCEATQDSLVNSIRGGEGKSQVVTLPILEWDALVRRALPVEANRKLGYMVKEIQGP